MKLLLVEDDHEISELLSEVLRSEQYIVDIARDGEEGKDFVKFCDYDLLLLDVTLPKLNGIDLCRQLRAEKYQKPVMILSGREEQVKGLNAGADDYMVKPYKLDELLARIRALLRRKTVSVPPVLRWGDLSLDSNTCKVNYAGQSVNLTRTEYRLLELFLRNNDKVLSRSKILDNLWSFDEPPGEYTIKSHMRRLRKKLLQVGAANDFIETVYGLGYRLKQLSHGSKTALYN